MRRLVIPLLATSLVLVSVGTAAAADPPGPYILDPISCAIYNLDGDFFDAVPAGSEVEFSSGWFANTRGQLQSFLNNASWILTVNGEAVDLTPDMSGPIAVGPFWGDFFDYSAGTLGVGETLTTHFDWVLKSANFDGEFHYMKGSVLGGVDCAVTAE